MFRFRLQRVLDLRVKAEEGAAIRLADARHQAEAATRTAARLEATREEGMHRATARPGQPATVGQLQNLRYVIERLNHEVEHAYREVEAASKQVDQRLDEFSAAFRDRRVLDKLRERALESWKGDEVQADRQAMDNIALARFVRSRGKARGKGE